ncbi:hypothetical protein PanWU01x14_361740, partial [Parasponia andersonii]
HNSLAASLSASISLVVQQRRPETRPCNVQQHCPIHAATLLHPSLSSLSFTVSRSHRVSRSHCLVKSHSSRSSATPLSFSLFKQFATLSNSLSLSLSLTVARCPQK